jgi:hypothetical protein
MGKSWYEKRLWVEKDNEGEISSDKATCHGFLFVCA